METQQTASLKSIALTKGFLPMWGSQCLLSFNDNCFKILVSMVAVETARQAGASASDLPLVAGAFVTPFLLFSGLAGRLADSMSKPKLLQIMKAAEVLAMLLGTLALASGHLHAMLGVVFLMGMHSTFYGPARSGLTPELVGTTSLAGANGLLDMGSYLSIVVGTLAGTLLFAKLGGALWMAGALLTTLAMVGFLFTLRLPKGEAASKASEAKLIDGLRHLVGDQEILRTVLGIAGFWFLGALMQMLVLLLAKESLHIEDSATGLLLAALAVGIGLGSLVAGRISANGIELGLVPVGGLAIVAGLLLLAQATTFGGAVTALFALGLSAGLWIVPLDAYLQFRTRPEERGRMLGASNFVNTLGTLAAPALLWVAQRAGVPVQKLLYVAAAFALCCAVGAMVATWRQLIRMAVLTVVRLVYRIRLTGAEHIPAQGGALLVANHVTYVDGLLIATATQRLIRFLVIEKHYQQFAPLMRSFGAIPVRQGRPRDVVQMIERSREALKAGDVVCIFPEGNLTHTGNTQEFQRGMEKIAEGLNVPIIPIHLGGLWGSVFSFSGGKFFGKRPKQMPYPVSITIGAPLAATTTAVEARDAVLELGVAAAQTEAETYETLPEAFVKAAKQNPEKLAVADSSGKALSYREMLTASLLLARDVKKLEGDMVGLLLPASVGGALVNVAALMAGKTPVNLNFTSGAEAMESAIRQCGIERVVTSKVFLAKAKMEERAGMVYLEDLLGKKSGVEKAIAYAATYLPAVVLRWMVRHGEAGDLATVIFSSGSSGQPKGVMLSHANIRANIEGSAQAFAIAPEDRIAGVLPFFHSFGFTFTLWFPLVKGLAGVYHANPLDAKAVGTVIDRYKATLLLATPTFLSTYTRVIPAEQMRSLRTVLAGAEKLRESVAEAFAEKFGVMPREGYGATEMAPVIAVNVDHVRYEGTTQHGWASGSVGRVLPGMAVRVVDPETYAAKRHGEEGLILVNGANRMMGYLHDAARTAQVLRDGWYNTGDMGRLDEEGFLYLTGRLSRFSKIAGEMVPHGKVEEAIAEILGQDGKVVVVSLPCEERGEKLAAVFQHASWTAEGLAKALLETGLPKLWLPKRDCLVAVEEVPLLGTGKADLRRAKEMAMEALCGVSC